MALCQETRNTFDDERRLLSEQLIRYAEDLARLYAEHMAGCKRTEAEQKGLVTEQGDAESREVESNREAEGRKGCDSRPVKES